MAAVGCALRLSREGLRSIILYEFRLGSSVREAATRINMLMGGGTVSNSTVHRWFQRFTSRNFSLEDEPHTGRPLTFNEDCLKESIEQDPRQTTRCLAEGFQCSHRAIENHLHSLGYAWRYAIWIPHALTVHQLRMRSDICNTLLTSHYGSDWLDYVVTGDEKWVFYVNYSRKRQWLKPGEKGVPIPRPESKKIMLCCWWNVKGVVHWELLPYGSTINAEIYCEQLDRVAAKLRGIQRKVFFLHDNARPHVAKLTHMKLRSLGWTALPHPPYSPDIAPSDYHLFRSLAHHLEGRHFLDEDDLKMDLQSFFDRKSPGFYREGIYKLPERWQHVVDTDGGYVSY